ncbi:MAG: hypothetical protein O3A92_12155 [Verrucomicrobia bacterium]|nr:hypothetical protein [Verrucomicrobiota bacterium]
MIKACNLVGIENLDEAAWNRWREILLRVVSPIYPKHEEPETDPCDPHSWQSTPDHAIHRLLEAITDELWVELWKGPAATASKLRSLAREFETNQPILKRKPHQRIAALSGILELLAETDEFPNSVELAARVGIPANKAQEFLDEVAREVGVELENLRSGRSNRERKKAPPSGYDP